MTRGLCVGYRSHPNCLPCAMGVRWHARMAAVGSRGREERVMYRRFGWTRLSGAVPSTVGALQRNRRFAFAYVASLLVVPFAGLGLVGIGAASAQDVTSTAPSTAPAATAPTGSASTNAATSSAPTTTLATGATTIGATTTAPGPTIEGSSTSSTPTSSVAPTSIGPVTPTTIVLGRVLKVGTKGDDVEAMKRKLDLLRYDVGGVSNKFDWQTWQGLVAFQKLNGLSRTGKFDAQTQQALARATTPGGVLPNGGLPRLEVDLTRQVLLYFDQYGLQRVSAISSGSGRSYCEISKKSQQKVCGTADTPLGNFKIERRIKGDRESDLGHLYNPMYFTGGFAIHGSPSVPAGPASHGCVRVTNYTADWMFNTVATGTPVYVFD